MGTKSSKTYQLQMFLQLILFLSLLDVLKIGFAMQPSMAESSTLENEVKIGVILDMGSWNGRTIFSCIEMAVSDFYASNNHFRTRILLHVRDTKGDPMLAVSAAVDLLENVKVQSLLGPETYSEAKVLGQLWDKAKVPMFTFSSVLSSHGRHPFIIHIKQDENFQFKGLANVVTLFKWRMVNIVYEDSDYGRDSLPYLIESLKEQHIHIAHRIAICGYYTDVRIVSELHKLGSSTQGTGNIVAMSSEATSSRLFLCVKRLGMMKQGYAWILTEQSISTLDIETRDSWQGALGIKPHIPASRKLKELTSRWRNGLEEKGDHKRNLRELPVSAILAYDTVWALALSLEETGVLDKMDETKFEGLSGEFRILNGKLHSESWAVVNVIGKGERIVGFWTRKFGLVKETEVEESVVPLRRGLEAVLWPGDSMMPPRGLLGVTNNKKLRIGVAVNYGFPELAMSYHDPLTNVTKITGYSIEVLHDAISSLDYEVPYELILYDNKGSYNDLIFQAHLGEFDGVLGDITITENRSLYVDFTVTYTDLGVGTIAKRSMSDMWIFSKPLQGKLWLTSSIFFALMGLVVWIIEHPINEEFQGSISRQAGTLLSFGFSTLVYAHREKLKSNLSKFVVNVWLFVVLILTSSYTATLSSTLTVRQIQLASASDYIGVQRGSFLGGEIASNINFKDDRLQLYGSPEDYAAALSKGSKNGGVTAIIDEIPYIKIFLAKYGGDYALVASSSTTGGFGFGFRKDLPQLVSDMSRAILKMREDGKLALLEEEWFKRKSSYLPQYDASAPNVLDFHSFGGLFLIISLSIVLVLILHLIFTLVKKVQENDAMNKLLYGGYLAFFLRFVSPRNQNLVELAQVR